MSEASGHDDSSESNRARWFWIAIASTIAAALFWAATSNAVYDLTSPSGLSFHVLLRKAYSIVAFALVGFTADRALGPSAHAALRATVLVAAYSAAIEVAQAMHGSAEGRVWNAVDVLCGAAGGWLGTVVGRIRPARRRREHRPRQRSRPSH